MKCFGPLAALAMAGTLWAQTAPGHKRVVLIDLDGVPRDILKTAYLERRLPNFERILGRVGEKPGPGEKPGAADQPSAADAQSSALWFENATTVFPSVTLTGHASLFTGTYPGRHGIPGNQWFDRSRGQLVDYMSVAGIACVYGVALSGGGDCRGGMANRDLQAPTIYQAATNAGKTTAVVYSEYWAGATHPVVPSLLEALTFLQNHAFDFKAFDARMADHALAGLGTAGQPDLLTLYFAGRTEWLMRRERRPSWTICRTRRILKSAACSTSWTRCIRIGAPTPCL